MEIKEFIGKIFTSIKDNQNEELIFTDNAGGIYKMYHQQDCCENVVIDDIEGDLRDLLNTPILNAQEEKNTEDAMKYSENQWIESFTWTFYKLATIKGYVTIKWWGQSNGYYSESVDIKKIN